MTNKCFLREVSRFNLIFISRHRIHNYLLEIVSFEFCKKSLIALLKKKQRKPIKVFFRVTSEPAKATKIENMNWFAGTIAEAVNVSKTKNAIFVVYSEGT